MYTTYVLDPGGCVVEINHYTRRAAERSIAHRTSYGGIELDIEENPTNDSVYRTPCDRFCNGSCNPGLRANCERGEE